MFFNFPVAGTRVSGAKAFHDLPVAGSGMVGRDVLPFGNIGSHKPPTPAEPEPPASECVAIGVNDVFTINMLGDESAAPHDLTYVGSAVELRPDAPTGRPGSLYFPGSTSGYINLPDGSDWQFGTGDFTIEGYVYPRAAGAKTMLLSSVEVTNGFHPAYYGDTTSGCLIGGAWVINDAVFLPGEWQHVAVERYNDILTIYVNGSPTGTPYNCSGVSIGYASKNRLGIGTSTQGFTGSMAGLRVVKGAAVYQGAFTPPTGRLEVVPGTVLCLNPCGDLSSSLANLQIDADAISSGDAPSGLLPGSFELSGSEQLTIADSPGLEFGSADFTIDGHLKFSSISTRQGLFSQWNAGTNNRSLMVSFRGDRNPKEFRILFSGNGSSFSEWLPDWTSVSAETWYHLALVRHNLDFLLFVDGTLLAEPYTGFSGALFNSNASFLIGEEDAAGTSYMSGKVAGFRIVKGEALWTADFTPPASSFCET